MANTKSDRKENLNFEEGWPVLDETINKIIDTIEGVCPDQFTSEEYRRISTLVQEMCTSNSPAQLPEKLYERYENTCMDYVSSKVLPHLRGKNGEFLLKELVPRWLMYKGLRNRLLRIFLPLDKYFHRLNTRPSLLQTSNLIFYKLVFGEMNVPIRDAVISEINRERNEEKIDKPVVRDVVDIYVEMAEDSMKYYEEEFEKAILKDTARFYYQKASELVTQGTHSVRAKMGRYMRYVENRVIYYLRPGTLRKIPEVVKAAVDRAIAEKLEEMTKRTDE